MSFVAPVGARRPAWRLLLDAVLDRNERVRRLAVRDWAASLAPGARVLDVGAGSCPYRVYFAKHDYIAHDQSGVDYDTDHVVRVRSDVTAVPLPDASFDAILCTEVLEHVEEPLRAVDELARLLRPGGRLLLTVPAACRVHRVPTHFYGGFAPDFFDRSLVARGFRLDQLVAVGNWSEYMAQELSRVPYILRHETSLGTIGPLLGIASWPLFRIAVPLGFLAFSRIDRSTDLPLGWMAYATKR
jgi:SAM-dependent methyltransferase